MSFLAEFLTHYFIRGKVEAPLSVAWKTGAALKYIEVVKIFRKVALSLFAFTCLVSTFVFSGLVLLLCGVLLLSGPYHQLAILGLIVGTVFIFLSLSGLLLLSSERFWLKICDVNNAVEEVVETGTDLKIESPSESAT